MRYKKILLDADETLFDFRQAERAALEETCKSADVLYDETVLSCYHQINETLWRLLEQGQITQPRLRIERFEQLFAALGVKSDPVAFNRTYALELGRGIFLIDGALELCKTLTAAHCKLYIVTNGLLDVQTSRISGSLLHPYIERMFVSEEIGYAKPDARFFDAVFDRLDCDDRRDTILLGDSLTSDMQGARNAGIVACWFAPAEASGSGSYDYRISRLMDFVPIALGETESFT